MGHARLGRCNRRNLSGIKVDAMAEYGLGREHATRFVNVSVVMRGHEKVVHFLDFFAVLGEMSLKICVETGRQFGGLAHEFFLTSDRETRTECIFKPPVFGTVPFTA